MSRIRRGTCADPGPRDLHCTEPPRHRHSCYDAGADESWNDGSPEDWQTDTPHKCDDPACTQAVDTLEAATTRCSQGRCVMTDPPFEPVAGQPKWRCPFCGGEAHLCDKSDHGAVNGPALHCERPVHNEFDPANFGRWAATRRPVARGAKGETQGEQHGSDTVRDVPGDTAHRHAVADRGAGAGPARGSGQDDGGDQERRAGVLRLPEGLVESGPGVDLTPGITGGSTETADNEPDDPAQERA